VQNGHTWCTLLLHNLLLFCYICGTLIASNTIRSVPKGQPMTAVRLETRLWGGRHGFRLTDRPQISSLLHSVKMGCGTNPASYPIYTGGYSSGIKWFKREDATQSAYSAEIKNGRAEMSFHDTWRDAVHQHIGLMSTYWFPARFSTWNVAFLITPYSLARAHHRFRQTCCPHLQTKDWGN